MRIRISAKCSDLFSMFNMDGLGGYDGYVPDFFPEEHYGDYILLDIDTKTGQILNWPAGIKDSTVKKVLAGRKAK